MTLHTAVSSTAIRAHVRHGRLLAADELWTLLHCKSSAEITEFLKGTEAYAVPLQFLDSSTAHRGNLEKQLRSSLLKEAEFFVSGLEGARRKFFADWLGWFETEQLKRIFRFVRSRHIDEQTLRYKLTPLPCSELDYDALAGCKSYSGLLAALEKSRYADAVRQPLQRLEAGETDSVLELETALDHFTEVSVFNDLSALDKTESKYLTPLFGSRIDLLNLYILHRCLLYYDLPPDEIQAALIPAHYKVTPADLSFMASSPPETYRKYLRERFPYYSAVFAETREQSERELRLEMRIRRFNNASAAKIFRKGVPGFHTTVCYFTLKLHEIEDLIRITESVDSGLSPQLAAEHLIKPVADGGDFVWQL